jgi:hypothetical protein
MSITPHQRLLDTGMQFYAVGRYTVFAGVNLLAGNILHHAIEMILKGALVSRVAASVNGTQKDLQDLASVNCRLEDLWAEFKKGLLAQDVARYDRAIRELSRFEDLRGPHKGTIQGRLCSISAAKGPAISDKSWGRPEPTYDLSLEEIDDLANAILGAAGASPLCFTSASKPAKPHLSDVNAVAHA